MANPQVEDGYIRIATVLLEALARIRIPGEARQVLDVIIRKTYGFQRKKSRITFSQFAFATGLKYPNISRAIKKLLSMNLVIQSDNKFWGFQKNFDNWKKLSKVITLSKKLSKAITKVIQSDNKKLSKAITSTDEPKDICLKIQFKDNTCILVFDHWNSKNIIKHIKLTDPIKRAINGRITDGHTVESIKTAIDNYHFIISHSEYYFKYKWILKDFLQRGLDKFVDLETAKSNYIRTNIKDNPGRIKSEEGKYDKFE